ncbi:MAG TPA: hypothetical protein VN132_03585 [Bdellovibrio sp.]|nr:hypothetical protein [Bdellovibrio sp.]
MKEETKLIRTLCLLIGDGRKQGPAVVEKHLDNPSESWILKGLQQGFIEEITSLMSILHGCEITRETFKDFLVNKEDSTVEESLIQRFLWISHNGLPLYICAEVCRRHIPKERRPSFKEVDAMTRDLNVYRVAHDPSIEKVAIDQSFASSVVKKYLNIETGALIQLLAKSNENFKFIMEGKCLGEIWNFLYVLNRNDEVQLALFQRTFDLLGKRNQADYLVSYCPDEKARKANPVKIAKAWLKGASIF